MSTTSRSRIPTYATAADVLSRRTGSGIKMVGWTLARTILIAPPMMLWGVDAKRAWLGAATASVMISVFALLRIFNTRETGLAGRRTPRRLMGHRPMRLLRA